MNKVLIIILIAALGFIAYGYYVNSGSSGEGEKFIGIGVLVFAFILMPMFIYHRYKNKDLKNYSFKDFAKKLEDRNKD
jgi:hypothetical protein